MDVYRVFIRISWDMKPQSSPPAGAVSAVIFPRSPPFSPRAARRLSDTLIVTDQLQRISFRVTKIQRTNMQPLVYGCIDS